MVRDFLIKYSFQTPFIGRTVIVNGGRVEEAMKVLNRIIASEGLFDLWRRTRRYEKPTSTRRRLNWEKTKAIYDEDMQRKVSFVMRVNRLDPWLGRGPLS